MLIILDDYLRANTKELTIEKNWGVNTGEIVLKFDNKKSFFRHLKNHFDLVIE